MIHIGVDKVAIQDECENAINDDMDLDKKIIKLGELLWTYDDLILSINNNLSVGPFLAP